MSMDINPKDYLPEDEETPITVEPLTRGDGQSKKQSNAARGEVVQLPVSNRGDLPQTVDLTREVYREEERYLAWIDKAVNDIVAESTRPLRELIEIIDSRVNLDVQRNTEGALLGAVVRSDLSNDELDLYCIKIATLGCYLQEQVDKRALDLDIAEHFRSLAVSSHVEKRLGGKGDQATRKMFAEADAQTEEWVQIIKKNAYLKLKNLVYRSEKLYESLKKVIDRRRDQHKWDGRGY